MISYVYLVVNVLLTSYTLNWYTQYVSILTKRHCISISGEKQVKGSSFSRLLRSSKGGAGLSFALSREKEAQRKTLWSIKECVQQSGSVPEIEHVIN